MRKFISTIVIILLLVPVLALVLWSFSEMIPWPKLLPDEFSLRIWSDLIKNKELLKSIITSILISTGVVLVVLLLSMPAAIALTHYEFKGKKMIWFLIFAPLIIPSVSTAIGMHILYLRVGLTDSMVGVILSHVIPTIPYSVKILSFSLDLIDKGMREQSEVLGANMLQTIAYIYIPNLKPAIILSSILVFIISFSQYLITFLIGGGLIKTLPIMLFQVIQNGNRAEVSSYSLVFIVSALIATYFIERILGKNLDGKYMINI